MADRVEGRALSPRAFRTFGIEAVLLGPPVVQEGLVRREGVALWCRLPEHGPVFDRFAGQAGAPADGAGVLAVRVVVATTPSRDRALRVPALGDRAARVLAAAEAPALDHQAGLLLLVDEGPGETWLFLAEERDPAAALGDFLRRRGRTDFARARRRSRQGTLGSVGLFAGLALVVYSAVLNLGPDGQVAGGLVMLASLIALVRARPR
jgi:hypothetical protein